MRIVYSCALVDINERSIQIWFGTNCPGLFVIESGEEIPHGSTEPVHTQQHMRVQKPKGISRQTRFTASFGFNSKYDLRVGFKILDDLLNDFMEDNPYRLVAIKEKEWECPPSL